MDILSEYYTTGPTFDPTHVVRGHFVGGWIANANTGAQVTDQSIRDYLVGSLNNHALPSLDNFENLWVVFTPPGVGVDQATNGILGYHSWLYNPQGAPDSQVEYVIHYAVIPYPGGGNGMVPGLTDPFQTQTVVLSHELSEAVTDPDGIWGSSGIQQGSGWHGTSPHTEIGDLAEGYYGLFNGYVVQAEWSNANNNVVLPAGSTWLTQGGASSGRDGVDSPGAATGPTANSDLFQTSLNHRLTEAAPGVLANDSDPYSNPLHVVLDTTTANGALFLNSDGSFAYYPNFNFYGTDTFTYHVTDGHLLQ